MSFKEMIKTAYGFGVTEPKKLKDKQTVGPMKLPSSLGTAKATGGRGFQGAPVDERSPRIPMSSTQQYAAEQVKGLKSGAGARGFAKGGFKMTGGVPHGKPGAVKKPGAGSAVAAAGRGGEFQVASKVHTPFKKKASAKELIKAAQGMGVLGSQKAKSLLQPKNPMGAAVGGAAKKGFMSGVAAKSKTAPPQQPSFGFGASKPPKIGG
jgi:hypothetical protein